MFERIVKAKYLSGALTAAEVWAYVPARLTAAQAMKIAGPRPVA